MFCARWYFALAQRQELTAQACDNLCRDTVDKSLLRELQVPIKHHTQRNS